MKKQNYLLLFIIIVGIMLSACGSNTTHERNEKYTYGTLQNGEIESIYGLVGEPSQYFIEDYSDGVSKGSAGNFFVNVCETTCGGVVAYGEEIYVYSPDKNDKNEVKNAFISECIWDK